MANTIVPVKLRPHLIPFFYKEFNADSDAHYLNTRVKASKILINSSIGKLIRIALEKSDYPVKPQKFYIYFYFPEKIASKATAELYQTVNGTNCFLQVPDKLAQDINDIFEDLFRIQFINTIKIAKKYNPDIKIKNVIIDFIKEYSLDEFNFREKSLRRLYNNNVNKPLLHRMQTTASNRVLNYKQ